MKKSELLIYFISLLFAVSLYSCEAGIHGYGITECEVIGAQFPGILLNDAENFNNEIGYTFIVGDKGFMGRYDFEDYCIIDTFPNLTSVDLKALVGYSQNENIVVGDSGIIIKGFDTIITSGVTQKLNHVIHTWNTYYEYIAAGDSGTIIKSIDSGNTWYSVPSGISFNIYFLEKGTESNEILASCSNGIYLRSIDNGETWTAQSIVGSDNYGLPDINSISFFDNIYGWAAGNSGAVFKTSDGGNYWFSQNSGISNNINSILFYSQNYGYAVADGGRVIYTTNGGDLWLPHPVFDTITSNDLKKITQGDEFNFFAIGDSGTFIIVNSDIPASPLTGIITAGDNGDFSNLKSIFIAADYLGVSDSLSIEVQPGIYNEQICINSFSPEDPITRISGVNDSVEITKAITDTTNYTLKINGAKNITIENIKFTNPDTVRSRVLLFEGEVSDITFENVTFNGPFTLSNEINKSLVMNNDSDISNLKNIKFNNCKFNNGSYGIRFTATDLNRYKGLEITDCEFNKMSYYAVSLNYNDSFKVNGNIFDSTLASTEVNYSKDFEISKNKINSIILGMSFINSGTTGQNRNLISNNFLKSTSVGIILIGGNSNNDFYFNSVNISDTLDTAALTTSAAFRMHFAAGSGNIIKNNLFINKRKGYAFQYLAGSNPLSSLNYNNYYSNGNILASWENIDYADLSSFKTASGRDTNSVTTDVSFISESDLHLTGPSEGNILLKGIPVSNVITDIDGTVRSSVSPYKGADEGNVPFDIFNMNLKINFEAISSIDTIHLKIRNSVFPYNVIDSAAGLGGDGIYSVFDFYNVQDSTPYYIAVEHRNSIETWSGSTPSFSGDLLTYDFTTSSSQSYGNNMILKTGLWSFYAGDVNQDGTIDLSDGSLIDNDAFNFVSGYVPSDVNGDGIVDLSDAVFADNNGFNFVSKITP